MKDWVAFWALDEMYAGIPGKGAVDAWHEALAKMENLKLDDKNYCGAVVDIAKFFDQIRRNLVAKVAEVAGMPKGIAGAYMRHLEELNMYNCLAGGLGEPHKRRCGIPQGCPFSMAMVALIMRPWIIMMRAVGGKANDIKCFILADDVLIISTGPMMIGKLAEALNETHEYLISMGSKVAPAKSYNSASTNKAKKWLERTTWSYIKAKVEVISDFRYLGAHVTTRQTPTSATLDERWEKAAAQLKKLRFCPATVEAKAGIILAKTYAAAFYGIEAARMTPVKIAKLTAAVIDAFRSKNDNHNTDRFFGTMSEESKDLDPVVQILGRRVMQIRRTCCKRPKAEEQFKETLLKYAIKHKQGEQWPKWYHDNGKEEGQPPSKYPIPQPHPTTKDYDTNWDKEIDPQGPVGLLIESVVWSGLVIDKDLKLWQRNEEPVCILKMPIQHVKQQVHMMAARARTVAERQRNSSTTMVGLREIDREASKISHKLSEEEKAMVRTAQMGGTMAKQTISGFNQDVSPECNYCNEGPSIDSHVKWGCSHFEAIRRR